MLRYLPVEKEANTNMSMYIFEMGLYAKLFSCVCCKWFFAKRWFIMQSYTGISFRNFELDIFSFSPKYKTSVVLFFFDVFFL